MNRKKVQRLWREEGLRVPPKRRKRQRLGDSTTPADRLRAERPDHVWALDYQFDVTATGQGDQDPARRRRVHPRVPRRTRGVGARDSTFEAGGGRYPPGRSCDGSLFSSIDGEWLTMTAPFVS